MLNAICKKCSWCNADSGLLVLRVGVGAIFIFAGWCKISNLTGTVTDFGNMGFGPFWAYLVTCVELLGGIAVLLGVYTRIASAVLAVVMIVAIYELRTMPQFIMTPISILVSLLALKLAGGGKYALVKESCCGSGACCAGGVCEGCKKDGEVTSSAN